MQISQQQMNIANQLSAKQNSINLASAAANAEAASIFSTAVSDANGDSALISAAQAEYDSAIAQNGVDTALSNSDIQALKDQDNALDTQRQTLETQLQAAQNELESVKSAEESAIKNETPKSVG